MSKVRAILVLILAACILNAQELVWQKTFGGSDDDAAYAMQVLQDGSIVVAGYTESYGKGRKDVYVLKLDRDGNKIWEKTFGGNKDDIAFALQVLNDGSIVVAGVTLSYGTGGGDVYVLKLDKEGNKIWDKTFGGDDNDGATDLQVLSDGSLLVSGETQSYGAGEADVYVLKLDKDGNKIWDKTFGGRHDDWANALKVLDDGSIVIAGLTYSYGVGGGDVYVLKLDENGNKVWGKTFGGSQIDEANALQVLEDGSIVVAGYTGSYGARESDIYVLKLDRDGNKIWEKTLGGGNLGRANALQILPDDNIIVVGMTISFKPEWGDEYPFVYVLRIDRDGDKIWDKTFGGRTLNEATSLKVLDDGSIVIAGIKLSYKTRGLDVYVLKIKLQGVSPYAQLPPFLEIKDVKVTDSDEDGIFSAGENAHVKLKIVNTGKGNAYNVKLRVTGFINRNIKIGEIKKGEEIEKSISFKIPLNVKTGEKSIKLMVDAGEYSPEPVVVKFYTHAPLPPSFRIIASIDDDNVGLSVGNGDGIIQPREQIELHLKVKNVGKGKARDVKILGTPKNKKIRMIKGEDKLGNLPPGGEVEGTLVFFVPSEYSRKDMAINVRIEEATGLWNVEKELNLSIGRESRKEYVIRSRKKINGEGEFGAEFMVESGGTVDVDENIPLGYSRSNAIGIVISNKNYEHSDVPPVDYAIHDGEIIKEYFKRTFGIPERNIYFVKNAKKVDFEVWFGTGKDYRGKLYRLIRKGSNPDIYIYYVGHGAPDPATRSAYFVPVDANPSYINLSGYPLDLFYKNLSKLPARDINIIIDACFSGGSQRGMLIARASPLGVVPVFKSKRLPSNFTVITATDTTGEIASWYPQKRHSLFTYYFLKGIRGEADGNKDRKITLSELQNYLESEVSYTAGKLYNRDQHPMVIGNLNKIFVRLIR